MQGTPAASAAESERPGAIVGCDQKTGAPNASAGGAGAPAERVLSGVAPHEEGHRVVLPGAVQIDQEVNALDDALDEGVGDAPAQRAPAVTREATGQVEAVHRTAALAGGEGRRIGDRDDVHRAAELLRVQVAPDQARGGDPLVLVAVHPAQNRDPRAVLPAPDGQQREGQTGRGLYPPGRRASPPRYALSPPIAPAPPRAPRRAFRIPYGIQFGLVATTGVQAPARTRKPAAGGARARRGRPAPTPANAPTAGFGRRSATGRSSRASTSKRRSWPAGWASTARQCGRRSAGCSGTNSSRPKGPGGW